MSEREALALDQAKNDFSRGRRACIDDHQIAIAWIAAVMVDVDPDFCRADRSQRGSQPILNCRVECDGYIDMVCRRGRLGQ